MPLPDSICARVCVSARCHGYPGEGYRDLAEVNTSSAL